MLGLSLPARMTLACTALDFLSTSFYYYPSETFIADSAVLRLGLRTQRPYSAPGTAHSAPRLLRLRFTVLAFLVSA